MLGERESTELPPRIKSGRLRATRFAPRRRIRIDTFTRTVGDRGPARDRTVSLPPSHNYELVWRGPLRRRRSIYSQYVLSHTIFIGVQSVSFVAVPPAGRGSGLSTTDHSTAHRVSKDGSNTVVQENR